MYRTIEDFVKEFKAEGEFTIKIFEAINEEIKAKKSNENIRSLEKLAWHITQTLTEMPSKAGLIEEDFLDKEPIPQSFNEIIDTYQKYSDLLVDNVQKLWDDDGLLESVDIYNMKWERRKILSVLIRHQIHHRGQMTALMRVYNCPVPGTYGPSREEWAKYGMEAHD